MSHKNNIKKIALLATGDEISNGDILNTNSQEIAQRLFTAGMQVGMHITTSDNVIEIEHAMRFLLNSHDALIITGGLGPTSDDLTRYALSTTLDRKLEFDEPTWQAICERLQKFGYGTPPESNRQQALFPEGAEIIPNPNGTAAGCKILQRDKWIFMLPGPPFECLPMVDQIVLPTLKQNQFQQIQFHKSWLLFGVSEGQIAEELDALVKPFDCKTGYRISYPYIEFKIFSNSENNFLQMVPLIEQTIKPYLITEGKKTASMLLREKLAQGHLNLAIQDQATGGALETALHIPDTHSHLQFCANPSSNSVVIKGLEEYWKKRFDLNETTLEILFNGNVIFKNKIPFRSHRVKLYAIELISHEILKMHQTNHNFQGN